MTVKDRLHELRKIKLSLTMEEFGSRVGVGKSAISEIENGRREPSNQLYKSICREFSVNEEWLRTGEGQPFKEKTRDQQIEEMVNEIMAQKPEDFRRRFIKALTVLDADGWRALEKFIDAINEERKNMEAEESEPVPSPYGLDAEDQRKVDRYAEELRKEKKQESRASSAG